MATANKKQRVLTSVVAEPAPGLWSNCMRVGEIVYVAGLTSRAADGTTIVGVDEYEQTQEIYTKIAAYMEAAGGCMNDIVQMIIYYFPLYYVLLFIQRYG